MPYETSASTYLSYFVCQCLPIFHERDFIAEVGSLPALALYCSHRWNICIFPESDTQTHAEGEEARVPEQIASEKNIPEKNVPGRNGPENTNLDETVPCRKLWFLHYSVVTDSNNNNDNNNNSHGDDNDNTYY